MVIFSKLQNAEGFYNNYEDFKIVFENDLRRNRKKQKDCHHFSFIFYFFSNTFPRKRKMVPKDVDLTILIIVVLVHS